jgi:RNA recognition motif-containing protein
MPLSLQASLGAIILAVASAVLTFLAGILVGRRFPGGGASKKAAPKPKPAKNDKPRSGKREVFVGNLAYSVTEADLRGVLKKYGTVRSIRLIENRFSGKPKGYGFVEMGDSDQANAAIEALNGKEFKGRKLIVNQAKSRSRDR